MSALNQLLDTYRTASQTQREKGTYFEELMVHYFKNEPLYQDLYQEVWLYTEWAEQQQLARKNDTGIDLVAQTRGTNEFHAIQCKNYAEDYKLQKSDIDSFFTASGKTTFTQRIIVSTTIPANKLPHKYKYEIHANEIVLLAYYIAAINIEAVYHAILTGNSNGEESTPEIDNAIPYTPFEGICLTDTFQMYEKEDLVDKILVENSHRRKRQKKLDIRVIIGNPPYSIGQANANNNNQNVEYPQLDERITKTYVENSQAALSKGLYDSYIRAIRWASDRIGNQGVIGFVSGSGFVEKSAMDGMRKTLVKEFTNIHVLNLRGDIRKNMLSKGRAREGENIFGSGSMTGIAITLFVKNPNAREHGKIFYHNIGNDLTRDQKLGKISELASLNSITQVEGWQNIIPDNFNDWLNQRDPNFDNYISIGDKRDKKAITVFENYSLGVATNRDAWVYNLSKSALISNISRMISFYNGEVQRFNNSYKGLDKNAREKAIDGFINTDPKQISWTRALKNELVKNKQFNFEEKCLSQTIYRPFTKQWLYFNRTFNEMVLQMPRIFPAAEIENLVICASGIGSRSGFSTLIMDQLPSLDTIEKGQCFPLYLYENTAVEAKNDLFASAEATPALKRRDAISNEALQHFNAAYPNQRISKEDIFYYIYGLLHSEDYRENYADNLSKQLPRIPCVKTFADFSAFSQAGRDLAALHLNYETVAMPTSVQLNSSLGLTITPQKVVGGEDADFYVTKMKFAKKEDKTKVIYNGKITIENIPEEAYDYVVNGKPALEWVMERQAVTTDKYSGITNDANDWAIETMQNARYPLELFLRVITVSLETNRIVNNLPKLDI